MPKCKNAEERYKVYDKLFRDASRPKGYCWEEIDLALEQNITQQQFNRDIKNMITLFFLKDENDDIEKTIEKVINKSQEGKKTYYTYINKSQGIDVNNRTFKTLEKLSQMEGLGIDELIDDLCVEADIHKNNNSVISYVSVKNLVGMKWLLPFYYSIINKQVLEIDFLKEFTYLRTYTIHPYHLRRYNSRWYLFGWNPKANCIYNIALDRVTDFRVMTDMPYEEADSHNVQFGGDNDFYKNIVGVTRDPQKPVNKIYVKFSETSFNYIKTKPLHPSQKIENENSYMASIEVSPNYELDSLILSFGENAEVIGPQEYREHIKERTMKLFEKYSDKA